MKEIATSSEIIYQMTLKNALEHNGIADAGSIMGLIMSPQYGEHFEDIAPNELNVIVRDIVGQVNDMNTSEQQNEYNKDVLINLKKDVETVNIEDPFLHKLREVYPLYTIIHTGGRTRIDWQSPPHPTDLNEHIVSFILSYLTGDSLENFLNDTDFENIIKLATGKSYKNITHSALTYTKAGDPFLYAYDPDTHKEHKIVFSLEKTENKRNIPSLPINVGNIDLKFTIDGNRIDIDELLHNSGFLHWKTGMVILAILKLHGYTNIFCNEYGIEKPFWYQNEIEDEIKPYMQICAIPQPKIEALGMPHAEHISDMKERLSIAFPSSLSFPQVNSKLWDMHSKLIKKYFGEPDLNTLITKNNPTSSISCPPESQSSQFADNRIVLRSLPVHEYYAADEITVGDSDPLLTAGDVESIAEESSLRDRKKDVQLPYTSMTGTFSQYTDILKDILINKTIPSAITNQINISIGPHTSGFSAMEHIYKTPDGNEIVEIDDMASGQRFNNRDAWLDWAIDHILPQTRDSDLMELLENQDHIPTSVLNDLQDEDKQDENKEWYRYDLEAAFKIYIEPYIHEFITETELQNNDDLHWYKDAPEPIKDVCGRYKFKIDNDKLTYDPTIILYQDNLNLNKITFKKYNFHSDKFFYFKRGDTNIYYMNWTTGEEHSMSTGRFLNQLLDKINDIRASDDPIDQRVGKYMFKQFYQKINKIITNLPPQGKSNYYVTISTDPKDILKKSTGQGWTSCEELGKDYGSGCIDDIRVKNAIAYLTKENSDRWITRVMVRWCTKENGYVDIGVEQDTYGDKIYGKLLSILTRYIITKKGYMNYNKKYPCITPYKYTGSAYSAISQNGIEGSKLKFHATKSETKPVNKLPDGAELIEENKDESNITRSTKEKRWEIEDNWEEQNEPNDAWASQDVNRPNDIIKIVLLSAGIAFITTVILKL